MLSSGWSEDQFLIYMYCKFLTKLYTVHFLTFLFLRENQNPPFASKMLSFFYILPPCILTLHLYVLRHFSGYLSHQNSTEGGRRGCKLRSYCPGVISTLMQLIWLVQGIQYRGRKYLFQEASPHILCPHCGSSQDTKCP